MNSNYEIPLEDALSKNYQPLTHIAPIKEVQFAINQLVESRKKYAIKHYKQGTSLPLNKKQKKQRVALMDLVEIYVLW